MCRPFPLLTRCSVGPAAAGPSSSFRISPKLCPAKNSLAAWTVPWSTAVSQPPTAGGLDGRGVCKYFVPLSLPQRVWGQPPGRGPRGLPTPHCPSAVEASPSGGLACRGTFSLPTGPAPHLPCPVVGGCLPGLSTSSYALLISPRLPENFLPPGTTRTGLGVCC